MDTMVTVRTEKTGDFEPVKNGEKGICLRLCSHWANRGSAGGNTPCRCLGVAEDAPGGCVTPDLSQTVPESRVLGRGCLQRSKRRRHRPGLKRSATGA